MDADLQAILDAEHKPAKGRLLKLLKKPNGVLTLMPSYSRAFEAIAFAKGEYNARELDEAQYVSSQYRLGGSSALAVIVGDGESPADDLAAFVAEQQTAKGEFPGPVPVVMAGAVEDALALAEAKRSGCTGVVLDLSKLGKDKTSELFKVAGKLGLECLVSVDASAESLKEAGDLGAQLIIGRSERGADLVDLLKAGAWPDGACKIAACNVGEVRGAWELRDGGFNAAVLANELLYQATVERVELQSLLKAMRNKGSTKFGKGTSMGRGEGAKEILGTIAV